MGVEVAVAGATGYAGGEALRLLLGHPEVTVGTITAGSNAGTLFGTHAPHLVALADRELAQTTAQTLSGADVVILALPHGQSAALAAELGPSTVVLDCGADHRLTDPAAWTRWYGGEHPGSWAYGLPELPGQREKLAGARRVAVPGCYPTVCSLALAPALAAGLVQTQDVVIVASSGTSGAGRSAMPHLLGSEVMGQMSAYGVGGVHRHTPEIIQNLSVAAGEPVTVSFTPTLAPMPRGILATATARVKPGVTTEQAREAYAQAWAAEPFVRLLPEGVWPGTGMVNAANTVVAQVVVDPDSGRLVAVAAVDNLTKGTAGAAVQCMNLALGLDETLGLPIVAVQP